MCCRDAREVRKKPACTEMLSRSDEKGVRRHRRKRREKSREGSSGRRRDSPLHRLGLLALPPHPDPPCHAAQGQATTPWRPVAPRRPGPGTASWSPAVPHRPDPPRRHDNRRICWLELPPPPLDSSSGVSWEERPRLRESTGDKGEPDQE
jgi:hypothetical protein